MIDGFRHRYGATPLHVVAHVVVFAVFAWVALKLADAREVSNIVLWFAAALVLHDLVLLPAYSALDRAGARVTGARVNYVRVPAALSALMLLLFFPAMFGRNEGSFARVAGVEPSGYLGRWLLLTAALFALAGLAYVARARRPRRRR